jgi:hypothetical protein
MTEALARFGPSDWGLGSQSAQEKRAVKAACVDAGTTSTQAISLAKFKRKKDRQMTPEIAKIIEAAHRVISGPQRLGCRREVLSADVDALEAALIAHHEATQQAEP